MACSKSVKHSRRNSQHDWEDLLYMWHHLITRSIATLAMNKIFIRALKIMRKVVTAMIRVCWSSHTQLCFSISTYLTLQLMSQASTMPVHFCSRKGPKTSPRSLNFLKPFCEIQASFRKFPLTPLNAKKRLVFIAQSCKIKRHGRKGKKKTDALFDATCSRTFQTPGSNKFIISSWLRVWRLSRIA